MTTINPPIDLAQSQGDLGFSYVFAQQAIRETLKDRMNLLSMGLVELVGDVVGSGSDTLRVTHFGNVGWDVVMAALASETDTITPTAITTGYSTVTIGIYGLGHSETYFQQSTGRERMIGLDALKGRVPESFLATIRSLVATAGSGFGTTIGSASRNLEIDDWLSLKAVYRETLGSGVRGRPGVVLSPQQVTQSVDSARNDPAYQNAVADFEELANAGDQMQVLDNFLRMHMRVMMTDAVVQSGGAYRGFAFSAGGIGWGRASTMPVQPANPQGAMKIPEFGILIEEIPGAGSQGKRAYEARSFVGVAAGSSDVHVQRAFISNT